MSNSVMTLSLIPLSIAFAVAAFVLWRRWRRALGEVTELGMRNTSTASVSEFELEHQRERLNEILESMIDGVVVIGDGLVPVTANRAAIELLGMSKTALPPRLPHDEITSIARRALAEQETAEEVVTLWRDRPLSIKVRAAPLTQSEGVLVTIRNVTEELRTQQMRREFVSHASHELKTPVAGIQALAESMKRAVTEDPLTAERFSKKLVTEAQRLGRLIIDLLDLSRLEDPGSISNRRVDLSEVSVDEVELARPAADGKGIVLDGDIEPGLWTRGDQQQLGLLVRNLLENAIQYTGDGGRITLKVLAEEQEVLVVVEDTGIGIPLQAQARVFERFYRVDPGRSRDRGGTGLGLAIVKHVTELHGGHVAVRSELGEGSTFIARLPRLISPEGGNGLPRSTSSEEGSIH